MGTVSAGRCPEDRRRSKSVRAGVGNGRTETPGITVRSDALMVLEMVNNSQYEYGYIHDALLVEVDAMVREGRKLVLSGEIAAVERALAEYADRGSSGEVRV